ncbi:hypothetical protein B0H14DRAFT_2564680 [Mycena olivaceomarginata]|nr:hypothetical protein B0H14DRAFT_2564680 [Mycena olivaceomarginata]
MYAKTFDFIDLGQIKLCLKRKLSATEEAEYVADSAKIWKDGKRRLKFWHKSAIQGFNKMKTVWTALADDHKNDPGRQAYALKTANMYEEMEKHAQESFREVGGLGPRMESVWLNTRQPT